MPRLTSARRLSIMSAALAFGEDRAATGRSVVSIEEIAASLGEKPEDVRESLEPLIWIEMRTPEGIIDLLDSVRLEDDLLIVEQAWWRRLAVLSPAEAARLYVKAAAGTSLEEARSRHLSSAMAKLRRMVGEITVVEGEPPPAVALLRKARREGQAVIVSIEGHDKTVVTRDASFRVVSVYRSGDEWMVTLTASTGNDDLDLSSGDPLTLPVRRLLAVIPSQGRRSQAELAPTVFDVDRVVDVTIEYPAELDWVLDPFATRASRTSDGGRSRVATVTVWGTPELKTLMLRLGPEARVLEPEGLVGTGSDAARELLELYES